MKSTYSYVILVCELNREMHILRKSLSGCEIDILNILLNFQAHCRILRVTKTCLFGAFLTIQKFPEEIMPIAHLHLP